MATFLFLQLFVTSDSVFALLSTPVVLILLTSRWLADEQICNIYIYISSLTVGVKHSIGLRTTFSPNLHSVEEEALECFLILQHQYHDFPTSYLKQTAWDR